MKTSRNYFHTRNSDFRWRRTRMLSTKAVLNLLAGNLKDVTCLAAMHLPFCLVRASVFCICREWIWVWLWWRWWTQLTLMQRLLQTILNAKDIQRKRAKWRWASVCWLCWKKAISHWDFLCVSRQKPLTMGWEGGGGLWEVYEIGGIFWMVINVGHPSL